jgi:hypothetical protein
MTKRAKETKQRTRSRVWRRVAGGLFFLVLLIVAGGVWAWTSLSQPPEWYAPPAKDDAETAALAEHVEYAIVDEVHRVREQPEPWTLRVREHQVNAWLASRLPKWIEHEREFGWPEELSAPQVHVEDGRLSLAMELRMGEQSRVITARVQPTIEGGKLRLNLDRVGMGRLAMPGEPMERLAELLGDAGSGSALDEPAVREVLDLLSGQRPIDSTMELSDGRRVEMLGIELAGDAMDLRLRTLPTKRGE